MNLKELNLLKETFYSISKIPFFALDEQLVIQYQSSEFISLTPNFFQFFVHLEHIKHRFHFIYRKHEIYIVFRLDERSSPIAYVCIGPVVYNVPEHTSSLDAFLFFKYGNFNHRPDLLKLLPRLDARLYSYFQLLYGLFYQELLTNEEFQACLNQPQEFKFGKQVFEILYDQREDDQHTYTYQEEILMMHAIRKGDSTTARIYASQLAGGRIGKMSADRLRKSKYAIISSIALITRAVIEEGVAIENAYAMNDVYITRVDEEHDAKRLVIIFFDAIIDFCGLVKLSQYHNYPIWIRTCMEYIDQHLHSDLTLATLGEVVHMAPAYISVQFKKIVGKSIKQYINAQKIKEAKFLLSTTDRSIQDIALTLNYGTQAYFTKIFKEFTGTLPNQYRNHKEEPKASSDFFWQ